MVAVYREKEEETLSLEATAESMLPEDAPPHQPDSGRRTGVCQRREMALVIALVAFGACLTLAAFAVCPHVSGVAIMSGTATQQGRGEAAASHAFVAEVAINQDTATAPPKVWPYPSLFCWLVFQSGQPEAGLVRSQFRLWLGIFNCDSYVSYSDASAEIGTFKDGSKYMSVPVGSLAAKRATWGVMNTIPFMKIWDRILMDGEYRNHDFVVKVDPDTVFMPWRLQRHLDQVPKGEKCYFRNSNTGDIPMAGPLEVLSKTAVDEYGRRKTVCSGTDMIVGTGEDGWIGWCMDKLGVPQRTDLGLLKNGMNFGYGPCEGGLIAAFHPFKDMGSWLGCKGRAER